MGTLFGIVRKHLKISDINHIKHIRMSFASGGQFPCKIVPLSKYSVTDLKKNEVFN